MKNPTELVNRLTAAQAALVATQTRLQDAADSATAELKALRALHPELSEKHPEEDQFLAAVEAHLEREREEIMTEAQALEEQLAEAQRQIAELQEQVQSL